MLVALAAIPALIGTLGIDRFGILTLAWMLIGYCGLFDMGLGRALTKLVSEAFGAGESSEKRSGLASTIWTSLALMFAFGCGGALLLAGASGPLANSALKVPIALQGETIAALRWIAVAIPVVTLTAGLRGILEAHQRFGSLSIVRALIGLLTFAGPLAAARIWGSLSPVIVAIVLVRLLSLGAHLALCASLTPDLFSDRRVRFGEIGPLFRFGGWLTVSNLISPLMVSMDRFLIGILLSVTQVAYYATPAEIIAKLQVIPAAITGVLFPAFSSSLASDGARAKRLFTRGLCWVLAIVAPIAAMIVLLAHSGLRLWLGEEFASRAYRSLQLLAIGALINSAANVATSFLHAAGRPDVSAKLQMIELPLYLPLVWWLVQGLGIEGAALAWVLRIAVDSALLLYIAVRSMPVENSIQWEVANAGSTATRAT
jgi:O-antigen/teichoic acid export membrane protein